MVLRGRGIDQISQMMMKGNIPQLDAVRGIAILLVMFHNSGYLPGLFASAWMGVDLFFVLSGFLITGILVDIKQSHHFFRNFYARRCLRIWPLYFCLLIGMFAAVPVLRPGVGQVIYAKSSPWWAYPLFLQNFLTANPTQAAGPLAVTWSLAIEEQFYLVWAMIVRLCSSSQLLRIAIAIICISPVLRFVLSQYRVILYSNLFCRLDGLMAGAMLAVLLRSENFEPANYLKAGWILLFVTSVGALVLAHFNVQSLVYSASAAASLMFVYVALFSKQRIFQYVMSTKLLTYTGTISYGLYLLHKIPFDVVKLAHWDKNRYVLLPAALLASYALAILSWNFLEKPFLRLKRLFQFTSARQDKSKIQFAHSQS